MGGAADATVMDHGLRARQDPTEWNEIEVTVRDNVAYCTCNGEVLEAAYKIEPTGRIGLEGDRGQMEYRRIRLKKLP